MPGRIQELIQAALCKEAKWKKKKARLAQLLDALPFIDHSPTLDLDELILLLEALVHDQELVEALRAFRRGGGSIRISDISNRQFPFLDTQGKLNIPYGLPLGGQSMLIQLRKLFGLTASGWS